MAKNTLRETTQSLGLRPFEGDIATFGPWARLLSQIEKELHRNSPLAAYFITMARKALEEQGVYGGGGSAGALAAKRPPTASPTAKI